MDLFEHADRMDRQKAEDPAHEDRADSPAGVTETPAPAPADTRVSSAELRATVVTLANALHAASDLAGIPASRVADWRSAVATFVKVTGREADTMPIAPASMVAALKAVRPGLFKIKAKRWANVRSSLAGLAAAVGWHADRTRLRMEVTGEWARLRNLLPRHPHKACFSGFARHCQACGIEPHEVDEAALDRYRHWLSTETFDLNPSSAIHGVRAIWNKNAGKTPDWPQRRLVAPPDPRNFALPLDAFPPSFIEDLDGFTEVMRCPDPFDATGAKALAEHTWRDRRGHLIRAASILVQEGVVKAEEITSLKVLASPTAFRVVLGAMHRKAGRTWKGNASLVAQALVDAARRWVRLDDATLDELEKLRNAVKPGKPGIGQRSQRRLQAFDDPEMLRRFFRLPGELFKAADRLHAEGRSDDAARLHERALGLAILQLQPLRRRTLARIDIEEHLRRDVRGRIVTLSMPGELTKNGVEISAPVPDDLARRMAKHIRVHLPVLRGNRAGTWLFPGDTKDGHKEPGALAKAVTKEVVDVLGIEFNLHLARHVAAMVLYDASPDAGPVAQRLLAHRQLSTTESFYGRLKTRSAHGKWGEILDGMRAKERKRNSGRKGGKS